MFGRTQFEPVRTIDCDKALLGESDESDSPYLTDAGEGDPTAPEEFEIPKGPETRLVTINGQETFGAEQLRTLAMRLRQAQKRHPIKKLLVTSSVPGEGKTLLAANLAITLAQQLKRVLLIDGDLRSSSLSRRFNIIDQAFDPRWSDGRTHRLPLRRKAEGLPLWVIPAGKPAEVPGNILQSSEFAEAVEASEREFDWILFDSPPLLPFGDASILASLADAIILVTRRGVTPKKDLRDALKAIDKSKIIATLLNCAQVTTRRYYRDYYSHARWALPEPVKPIHSQPRILNPQK